MPNRDYAARSKSKKGGANKLLILIIIILLLLLSGLGLWVLKQADDKTVSQAVVQPQTQEKKSSLPTRPEETYSYIRDLETREVPVDKNSKLAQLTKEQEIQIQKKQEAEKQRLEQQLQAQLEQARGQAEQQVVTTDSVSSSDEIVTATPAVLTPEQLAEKQAKEKKLAEEKRKQAELKKQQELAKKAEQEKQKAQQVKIVATAKPASEAPKSVGKYGLQCGAFKSKAQAENMQARLAMAGYNARVNSSADWNRVVVGPIGDRAAASAAQSNARSVAECLIVGM